MSDKKIKGPLVVALDLGTSSTRCGVFDAKGARVPGTFAQQTYLLSTGEEGRAELDPRVLFQAVENTLSRALRGLADASAESVAAVGVSCFWHSLLGVDREGNPLTPVYTWADSRCREQAASLRGEWVERQYHRRTGCMLRTSYWPAKLLWLRSSQKRLVSKVARWMSPAEWIQTQFCGEATCAFGMATGTGLFNPSKLVWDKKTLEHCQLAPDALNPLGDIPGEVRPAMLKKFPGLKGALWFPGIGDGAAGNLGCGASRPGLAAINAGTSGAVRLLLQGTEARAPMGLFAYRVDEARYLVGGAVSNLGNLFAWCKAQLRVETDDAMLEEELLKRRSPDPELLVRSNWTSERAPDWDEETQGAMVGITAGHTALDLMQAIVEGSYYRLARIVDLLEQKAKAKLILAGGLLHSPSAVQRLADVFGRPVYPSTEPEASLRGAAVFALEKLGIEPPPGAPGKPWRPGKKFHRLHLEKRLRTEKYFQSIR